MKVFSLARFFVLLNVLMEAYKSLQLNFVVYLTFTILQALSLLNPIIS